MGEIFEVVKVRGNYRKQKPYKYLKQFKNMFKPLGHLLDGQINLQGEGASHGCVPFRPQIRARLDSIHGGRGGLTKPACLAGLPGFE